FQRGVDGERFPLTRLAMLDLRLAGLDALGADNQLVGHTDEVHRRKLAAGALVRVVIEDVHARRAEFAVKPAAHFDGCRDARLAVYQPRLERRHRHRRHDSGIVVAGLDDRTGEPGYADTI